MGADNASLVTLRGVLEDGTPRATSVPDSTATTLHLLRGADVSVVVDVQTPQGTPANLAPADTAVLTVKKRVSDEVNVAQKTGSLAGSSFTFSFVPADFKQAAPGLYAFDVWLTKDGKRYSLLPTSPLYLDPTTASIP